MYKNIKPDAFFNESMCDKGRCLCVKSLNCEIRPALRKCTLSVFIFNDNDLFLMYFSSEITSHGF